MTRKEVKEMLPVLQAYAEGKEIENLVNGKYYRVLEICSGMNPKAKDYRIKPDPEYRPFEDTEECWQEMQKHQPFGWVRAKEDKSLSSITLMISERDIFINGIGGSTMYDLMEKFTFADGAVFGILEEE